MKTDSQQKFDSIIKRGFQEILKPIGFKKRSNNFYHQLDGLEHIINIQKSIYGTSDKISSTINIGVFENSFWLKLYDYTGEDYLSLIGLTP